MASPRLRLVSQSQPAAMPQPVARPREPLGQILRAMAAIRIEDLARARDLAQRLDCPLADVLLARGFVSEPDLMAAQSRHWQVPLVDLDKAPCDPRLIDMMGVPFWISEGAVPLARAGGATVIATSRPEAFAGLAKRLSSRIGPVVMALAPASDLARALANRRRTRLIRAAETRVDPHLSCRTRNEARLMRWLLAGMAVLASGTMLAPAGTLAALVALSLVAMLCSTGLKAAAFIAELRAEHAPCPAPPIRLRPTRPVVTVMVPLFSEADIAERLIERIGRQTYPAERLDILLVVEEGDGVTRAALARTALPHWMRVVVVPDGPIRTKPRAMNYALNFARGSLIGVWDAEDDPDPDQVEIMVRRFDEVGPDVACLQGILDYHHSRHNWLARCFTIEYAAWFRAQLPGVARLGLVVPLGGTTLFFRREALEELGGWDAHNVTEDADLGLRLARAGYRTELVATVTHEEPNARPLKWIRQRSRWIKGYAVTWGVHMRDPVQLWRDLGPRRFWAVQVQFLGSILQSLLAPVLWSFWIKVAGLSHPLDSLLGPIALHLMAAVFILSEAVNICVGLWATRGPEHRHLRRWVPTLHFYFPLAALAAWKALYEVVVRPFWWDKTDHGVIPDAPAPIRPAQTTIPAAPGIGLAGTAITPAE
jgi:glycosyltransferase involved in cell wall biosynthesis